MKRRISSPRVGVSLNVASIVFIGALFIRFFLPSFSSGPSLQPAEYHVPRVLTSWESNKTCFVQGFSKFNSSHHILACGGYGSSKLFMFSILEQSAGDSHIAYEAERDHFYEGATVIHGTRLAVLTWKEKRILEFELPAVRLTRSIEYPREGWGLAYDKLRNVLWASDGSATLYKLDPDSYETIGSCNVQCSYDGLRSESIPYLNELEELNGTIFANVYMDSSYFAESPNYIIGIDPDTCNTKSIVPIFGLEPNRSANAVFNGISEGSGGNLLVTGKSWNRIYEIQLGNTVSQYSDPLWSKYNLSKFYKLDLRFR